LEVAVQESRRFWLSPAEVSIVAFLDTFDGDSFHNNNNEVKKKNPPPTTPLMACVDVLNEM
jgi:hypothetical protein